jgi:hypothetical protein
MSSPIIALPKPLATDWLTKLEIIDNEKIPIAKYSHGPNLKATFAMAGAMKISITVLKIPPMNELTIPTPKAFPASPRNAIGEPS